MPLFKNINYGRMLYEALRGYFSVNTSGQLSWLYKYCAACLQPLQAPFDIYKTERETNYLVAQCKWQMAQLTNLLNYLFDSTLNRIYIDQAVVTIISDPQFEYPSINFDPTFDYTTTIFEREFGDKAAQTNVIIHVPASIDQDAIKAVIEQIRIQGLPYEIQTF